MLTDNYHKKKLNDAGINIKTKYIVGNKILERNTNNSVNDDIKNGVRCEKIYYKNNKQLHKEKLFDTRIEYTFISEDTENKEHKCINCGMTGKIKDFVECCPFCRTEYNIDYTEKDLGGKYHYDRVLKSNKYRIVTGIIDLIISLILSYIFIKNTSRTFNNIDIIKVIVYGFILSMILYYFFYLLDAYVILEPIKRYKDKQNQRQKDFWNRTKIDKKTFFNNLNYEIRKYNYENTDVIDYDIIDYIDFKEFEKDNKLCVEVTLDTRKIKYKNNKISSKIETEKYTMMKHEEEILELKDGVNLIKCSKCGSSIEATNQECSFCHNKIKYLQEWILINK